MIYIFILFIIFLSVYIIDRKTRFQKNHSEITIEELQSPEPILYQLNTHKVKYKLYNSTNDLRDLVFLYKIVVKRNYWINEPFHSQFYKILLTLEKNDFMILDPSSKTLTINVRDKYNEVQTSKSFQVFSTRDITEAVITKSMKDITKFNKNDAQNILITIFILVLEKSVHYLSQDEPISIIKELLSEYKYSDNVKYIIDLIKEKDSKLIFVKDAFKYAFRATQTLPYNDSEVPQPLQLPQKIPQKFFQEI